MRSKKILFIGPLGGGEIPNNGASIKNQFLVTRLQNCDYKIKAIDTENWKRTPLILVKVIISILFSFNSKIIVSTSFLSAYKLISIASKIINPRRIYYWVIGGALAEKIIDNNLSVEVYKKIYLLIVEGKSMLSGLKKLGIENTVVVPNFKKITNLPSIPMKENKVTEFVFLSRIIPEKGCELILEALRRLSSKGFQANFNVTFYGPIDEHYRRSFLDSIGQLPNASYGGFLDLREWNNYSVLAKYDCLLFPTYWPTEGFPGIIVDAMIAGLPVLASRWNMNVELIEEGKNGYLIEPKDIDGLEMKMKFIIENPTVNQSMRVASQEMARKYDINNIITVPNLEQLDI